MPPLDPDDPRLDGYLPIEFFRVTDVDRTSLRIRDDPLENLLLSGTIYDFNIESLNQEPFDDWNT